MKLADLESEKMAAASEHMRQHLVDQREPGLNRRKDKILLETETEHECTTKVESVQGFFCLGSHS